MNLFQERYLSFDIETAKCVPAGATEILAYRPLGISCAAACMSDTSMTVTWYGLKTDGKPAGQMSHSEAASMVDDLIGFVRDGYTLVTWNGLGFDLDILAEESGKHAECAELAISHVDMLFHAVCVLGHYVSLQKAAEGMAIPGKLDQMSGAAAPEAWARGRHQEVLDYVIQDAVATCRLAAAADESKELAWITRAGKRRSMPLRRGWLKVGEARELPTPDTTWMSDPPRRERLTGWLDGALLGKGGKG